MAARKNKAVGLLALVVILAWGPARADEPFQEIPAIPAQLLRDGGTVQAAPSVQYAQAQADPEQAPVVPAVAEAPPDIPARVIAAVQARKAQKAQAVASSETVPVAPGKNTVLVVAGNNLNRLVTPFANPVVNTVSNAKLKVDGSIIYVSLGLEDGPTTLFITEDGEPEPALSVTLMPQQVPPREIRLSLEGGWPVRAGAGNPKAAKWEKNEPYLEAIGEVIMRVARNELPQGYNLRRPVAMDPHPACKLPVEVEPGQVLEGHNLLVVVSRLTNVSSGTLLVDEAACYRPGVRAVAVWPKVQLAPRESTELYVVFGRDAVNPPKARPSVLAGDWAAPSQVREEPKPRPRQPQPEPSEAADVLARRVADVSP